MAAFIWDSAFVTGLDDIDQQHFYLVELINKFSEQLVQNELSEKKISIVFEELYDYTRYHFQQEENLMADAEIDAQFLSRHINVHQDFLSKITAMRNEISIDNLTSLKLLLDFLIHWLVYHILGLDQNMARQLSAINNGATPAAALQMASSGVDNATETLLRALNNLFQQVSERNNELHELNKTLELKVKQRTQALQEANQHLEQLAVTDVLTNLPNRRYAMLHLSKLWEQATQQNRALSCLMIDVDHFKFVNDSYGHDAGDQILIELSQQLQQRLRNDDIVCRLGGDEFLVICENTDFAGAQYLAQLLCNSVSELKVQTGDDIWIGSISIGVASKVAHMQYTDELIKQADQGVYLAKQAGKGCVRSLCA